MFDLDQSETYRYPVELVIETDTGPVDANFTAIFARLPSEEIEEVLSQATAMKILDVDVVNRVLRGWDGVFHKGEPVSFNAKNLKRVLAMHPAKRQIALAWAESVSAVGRRKN